MQDGALARRCHPFSHAEHPLEPAGFYSRGYVGEADLFLVFCPETDRIYAVPVQDAGKTGGSLRVDPTANKQMKKIVWAVDYELLPAPYVV
jgi:hypothetical protein